MKLEVHTTDTRLSAPDTNTFRTSYAGLNTVVLNLALKVLPGTDSFNSRFFEAVREPTSTDTHRQETLFLRFLFTLLVLGTCANLAVLRARTYSPISKKTQTASHEVLVLPDVPLRDTISETSVLKVCVQRCVYLVDKMTTIVTVEIYRLFAVSYRENARRVCRYAVPR